MSKILVITDKLNSSRNLAKPLQKAHPESEITFIHTIYFQSINFEYPRSNAWSDYPITTSPLYRFLDWSKWMPKTVNPQTYELENTEFEMRHFDTVIFAGVPNHTDCHRFELFRERFLTNQKILYVNIFSFYEKDIEEAINSMSSYSDSFNKLANAGKIKNYFDWNYNVNAQAIMNKTAYVALGRNLKHALSKHQLQNLYWMIEQQNITQKEAFEINHRWVGTGKHSRTTHAGSPVSISNIMSNLFENGFLTANPAELKNKETFSVSDDGKRFLSFLHKDCKDLDLPFRLNEWMNMPFNEAKPKIDTYIRTFFGKQKRFIGKKEAELLPYMPYDMHTLLKIARERFNLSPRNTTDYANLLHEKGYISQPRTSDRYLTKQYKAKIEKLIGAVKEEFFQDGLEHGGIVIIKTEIGDDLSKEEKMVFDLILESMLRIRKEG